MFAEVPTHIRQIRPSRIHAAMFTVATTHRLEKDAAQIWSEAEIDELIAHISADPRHGDLIPGTGGLRKLRWARAGVAVDRLYKGRAGQH